MEIKINHKYWLCLEPYVFLFKGKLNYIIYNGFSHNFLVIDKIDDNRDVTYILDLMTDIKNMYCVRITGERLLCDNVLRFLNDIRDGFYGDIYDDVLFEKRPVIFPPIANVKNSYDNLSKEEELIRKSNIDNFLHEITIYINGICNNNCKHCLDYYKQFIFCTKSHAEMSEESFNNIIDNLKNTRVSRINIVEGNIFLHKSFEHLLCKLEGIGTKNIFYTHFHNIDFKKSIKILELGFSLCICVSGNFNKNDIDEIDRLLKVYNNQIIWKYIVASEEELNKVDYICECKDYNYSIRPMYDKNNIDFFEKFVYNNEDDFYDVDLSCEDVIKRQMINLYDYGKLIITPQNEVYSNINYPVMGLFENDFVKYIKMLLTNNSPWFRTREKLEPCRDCSFKYLCSSPSNYEIILNKNNLCTIFK